MMNALKQAWDVLEGIKPGLYGEHIRTALDMGGIVHLAPDCVYMGIPRDPVPTRSWCCLCAAMGRVSASRRITCWGWDIRT